MAEGITIQRLEAGEIELVAPLWKELLDHIAGLPGAVVPVRPFEQSWPLERRVMLDALEKDAFVLVARRDDDALGYAFVVVEEADPVWYTGDHYAEIMHLSVTDAERGNGLGTLLLDAVDAELERRGVEDVEIGVDAANPDALRFYERRGYKVDFHIVYGSPGRKPWACLAREAADRAAGRGRFAPGSSADREAGPLR
jgi:GNAT superfamily N-acetyltransferase